jgi:hypothetical protein
VTSRCAIELTHPRALRGGRWNQIFENPVPNLGTKVYCMGYDGRLFTGWVEVQDCMLVLDN